MWALAARLPKLAKPAGPPSVVSSYGGGLGNLKNFLFPLVALLPEDIHCMKSDSPFRTAISARLRLPAALLLLALMALLLPVSASADIALDARIGFGQSQSGSSRYRPGSWTPVTIYLTGQGARGVGQLTVTVRQSGHATAYTRKISLHDGPVNEAYYFVFDFRAVNYGMMGGNTTPEVSAQLVQIGRAHV